MSPSEYDQFRPPEPERRRRRGRGKGTGKGRRRGGSAEDLMVPEVEFTSYYGRNVVKAPPWEWPVALYLFTGGVAGASGVLAAGAQVAGLPLLRRTTRITAIAATVVSAGALVLDLGRPERFHHMLRTFKVTSPMSVGSWILAGFSAPAGVAAVSEMRWLPLGKLWRVVDVLQAPAGLAAGALGPPLAGYTAVLLADTAIPTWHGARQYLPFVFVSSASLAASGIAMALTPAREAGPARTLAVLGVVGDLVAMKVLEATMDPVEAEPLHHGTPGTLLRASEVLAVAGGIGALLARRRPVAVAAGLALAAASACTRFGVFEAGLHSAKDPRYTVVPQKRRLAERRAAGIVDDSITTVE